MLAGLGLPRPVLGWQTVSPPITPRDASCLHPDKHRDTRRGFFWPPFQLRHPLKACPQTVPRGARLGAPVTHLGDTAQPTPGGLDSSRARLSAGHALSPPRTLCHGPQQLLCSTTLPGARPSAPASMCLGSGRPSQLSGRSAWVCVVRPPAVTQHVQRSSSTCHEPRLRGRQGRDMLRPPVWVGRKAAPDLAQRDGGQ